MTVNEAKCAWGEKTKLSQYRRYECLDSLGEYKLRRKVVLTISRVDRDFTQIVGKSNGYKQYNTQSNHRKFQVKYYLWTRRHN